MELNSRGTKPLLMPRGDRLQTATVFIVLAIIIVAGSWETVLGQVERVAGVSWIELETQRHGLSYSNSPLSLRQPAGGFEETAAGNGGWNTRQALLIGGLATSMAAYGYFILEFNNSRGDAGAAEKAYEEDVRQNAQTYVDQGIELDEIQTFRDWQAAYDDAKQSREWAARAGFLAIVIGFFAVLDAATTYDAPPPSVSGLSVQPTLGLATHRKDLLVGARVKF